MLNQVIKNIVLSLSGVIRLAKVNELNPFGFLRFFYGLTIFPTIAINFWLARETTSITIWTITIFHAIFHLFLSVFLIDRISKESRIYTIRDDRKLSKDQRIFTIIAVLLFYHFMQVSLAQFVLYVFQ